ncbi:N-acyl-D-amino-acid deacylase family protein [Pseudonocardia spinosispora]|uniref:N-acyl-D-amino-acid deacylase family protein n=1 Tax=Pseudonocardia spinosispora TaxID=103441 RepID=UPI001FE01559|nr:amidohydrolase family protein [Pseudonocardia spinosispora]
MAGGWVVDGTGAAPVRADVGVRGDRIEVVGTGAWTAGEIIDVTGLTVVPGFIDPHSHSDWSILGNRDAHSTIRQGVTTEIVGNCGITHAPVSDAMLPQTQRTLRGYGYTGEVSWRSFPELLRTVHGSDGGTAQNLAWLVGHTALREAAGVRGTRVSSESTAAMIALLAEALDAGALGLSTGLEYGAGRDADTAELIEVAGALRRHGGIYASHIRNRDTRLLESVGEFLTIASKHQLRAQISHLNVRHDTGAPVGAWRDAVQMLGSARLGGLDVLADITPLCDGIGLAVGLLPSWLLDEGYSEAARRLADPRVRGRVRSDCDRYWRFVHRGQWDRVGVLRSPGSPELEGESIPRAAAQRGQDCWDVFFDLLAAAGADMADVQLLGRLFTPEHVADAVSHPLFCLGVDGFTSRLDGPLADRTRHPLFVTGHTHYLAHHVLRHNTLRLEEAVRKMTSMVADRFGILDRGRVVAGSYADLAVLDLDVLAGEDTGTYRGSYAVGVPHVLVNGVAVVRDSVHLGTRAGRHLSRS